ncbi:hypothetical protein ABZR37_03460 [Achromobacter ruhlandii]|uniref:hypothetical protein n=1 Tax=Achromobacter ruhlandii TaxID=72557 RepID=UPI0035590AEC
MKLEELERQLKDANIDCYIYTTKSNEDRLKIIVDEKYDSYFVVGNIEYFLNVWIKRAKGFDYKNHKQTQDELKLLSSVKFKLLNLLYDNGIRNGIETYVDENATKLFQTKDKFRTSLS